MSKDCRQHYELATGKPLAKPDTSDKGGGFVGPGGGAGQVYGPGEGQQSKSVKELSPTYDGPAHSNH